MAKSYKIHPAIGVGRLGNSPEWYHGPTTPGVPASPGEDGSFRDGSGGLRCQAAGFWVFEYDDATPSAPPVVVKVGPGEAVTAIEWTVHLANKKAFWFSFDKLTGSKDITNPPTYGYGATPASWRNSHITVPAQRRLRLIIDPGPRTLASPATFVEFRKGTAGGYPETWPAPVINSAGTHLIDSLGMMQVHADFSMTVIPAPGVSGSTDGSGISHFANNNNWFDNTSDGPVRATVVLADGTRVPAAGSWVIITPPDFAPALRSIVTLYDVIFDVGVRWFGHRPDIYSAAPPAGVDDFTSTAPPFDSTFQPSYKDDVYPILSRVPPHAWVQQRLEGHHEWNFDALSQKPYVPGTSSVSPGAMFNRLRQPEQWNTTLPSVRMPDLWGDIDLPSFLTLTPTQYHILRQWRSGKFHREGWVFPIPPVTPSLTASGLDRAALEACAGGSLYPGIEAGWVVRERKLYSTPFEFRFRHPTALADPLGIASGSDTDALYPGDLTKRMACPWQADFWKCNTQWWPAQRPDEVVVSVSPTTTYLPWARGIGSHMGMVVDWDKLGVVAPTTVGGVEVMLEQDRTL